MSYAFLGQEMPRLSMIVGGALAAWGVAAYVISGMASITAMIPTFMGAPILLSGLIADRVPDRRKAMMHIGAVFGLLSALGGLRLPTVLSGGNTLVIASHALLLVLGGVYTYACVMSFRAARVSGALGDS